MHEGTKLIHRDLKPENILLHLEGAGSKIPKEVVWERPDFTKVVTIKLADLGLSKNIDIAESTKTIVGTANFLAPEIVLGHNYDFKADVWSLGSLIFELVVGFPIMQFFEPGLSIENKFINGNWYLPAQANITLEGLDFLNRCLQF